MIWKEFIFGGRKYLVSDEGQLIGPAGIILKQRLNEDGYCVVSVGYDKLRKQLRVHRIIASVFIENPENKPEVNHKDGVKTNNRVDNLEWVNRSEQIKHAFSLGLKSNYGEKNPRSKLTREDVFVIRERHSNGESVSSLSREYGRGWQTINHIVKRTSWGWLV